MKKTTLIPMLSIGMLALAPAEEGKSPAVTPKKRATHEDLVKKKKELDKAPSVVTPDKKEPTIKVTKKSLIGSSTLLAYNGQWTLVPKGAVIHIPERQKNKVVTVPTGRLVEWKRFLRKNHGWIHIHAVTMTQAQGEEKINQDTIKAYKTMGKIVIATCAGGPISVAPDSLTPVAEKK